MERADDRPPPSDAADVGSRAIEPPSDTELVVACRTTDPDAFGALYDRWYDRVMGLCAQILWDRDAASDAAQETFVRAWRNLDRLDEPAAFGGWLLRIARNTALTQRERAGRTRLTDAEGLTMMEERGPSTADAPAGFRIEDRMGTISDPAAVTESRDAVTLLWDAADGLSDRHRTVLELQLRSSMTPAEIGDHMGLGRDAANQLVHRMREQLATAVGSRVLWRGGEPRCTDLRADLRRRGATEFGPQASKWIARHAEQCAECGERRRLRLEPAAMFAAIPVVAVSLTRSQQAAAELIRAEVPMGWSQHVDGLPPSFGGDGATGVAGPAGDAGPPTTQMDAAFAAVAGVSTATLAGGAGPDDRAGPDDGAGPGLARGEGLEEPSSSRRTAAIAALLLLLLGAGGLVWWAASDTDGTVRTGGAPTTTAEVDLARPATPLSTLPALPTDPVPAEASTLVPTTAPAPTTVTPRPTTPRPTAVPPVSAPTPTTTPPTTVAPPTVNFGIGNTPATTGYLRGDAVVPNLAWAVTGGDVGSVTVSGPGLTSTSRTGTEPICPTGTDDWSICNSPAGSYEYTITVTNSAGATVATRSATLVVYPTPG